MPAETRLFLCLNDNYGVLLHDPETGATAAIDAPEAAPIEAALADRLEAHRHPGDPSSCRPYRRHPGVEGQIPLPRGGAGGGGRQDPGGGRDRARGRQGQGRQSVGQCDRDAGPYARPHRLLVSRRQARLRRRHAVLDRLRPRDRGHAGADVALARQAARPARRYRDLLRPRIHCRQYPLCAHHRAGQSGAGGARRAGAPADRGRRADHSGHHRRRETGQSVPARRPAGSGAGIGMAGKPAAKVFAEIRARKNKF